jgi:hypothetical protein
MDAQLIGRLKPQLDQLLLPAGVATWWRIFSFDEKTGIIKQLVEQKNIIPFQGADVMAKLLSGDLDWAIGAMFFEFENTAGTPTVPSPARGENISYYLSDLALEASKDYVRVPLVVPPGIASSDSAKYDGNQATFFAVTSGMQGIHGKTFDHTVDSKVYGVALAATPDPDQYTQDRLFSRSYDGFDPVPKEDGYQVGAQYVIRCL